MIRIVPVGQARERRELSLIPLVNIIFLLLIFFMMAGVLRDPKPVALPGSEVERGETRTDALDIVLTESNEIHIEGQRVDQARLQARLVSAGTHSIAPVAIYADQAASAMALGSLLATLRDSGIRTATLMTRARQ